MYIISFTYDIHILFFSVPAVGAEFAAVDAYGFDHVIKSVVSEGGEIELLSDSLKHFFVFVCLRVRISFQSGEAAFTF